VLNRHYIGIEPHISQVKGGNTLLSSLSRIAKLAGSYKLLRGCAEDVMPCLESASFKLVFSSPPYFNQERYSADPSQSYIRFPRYAQWREGFLKRIITESARLLSSGGFLVINAANVNGYPIADDCYEFAAKVLAPRHSLALRLARKPYLRTSNNNQFKYEPLLVFQKH
jgi:DNA modification methylase